MTKIYLARPFSNYNLMLGKKKLALQLVKLHRKKNQINKIKGMRQKRKSYGLILNSKFPTINKYRKILRTDFKIGICG